MWAAWPCALGSQLLRAPPPALPFSRVGFRGLPWSYKKGRPVCGRSRAARCIRAPPLPSCVTLGPVTCPLRASVSGHGKSIGSRGNSECKGPEAGTSLVPSRPGQEVLMAGAEVAPGRPAGVGSQGGFRAGEPQAPLLISRSCLWLWGGEGAVGGHRDGRQWQWPGLGGRGGAGKR